MLIDASKRGDLAKLKDLFGRGANFLKTDHYGMTALHHAARFGHKEVVKYIIENGKQILNNREMMRLSLDQRRVKVTDERIAVLLFTLVGRQYTTARDSLACSGMFLTFQRYGLEQPRIQT